ncbi:Tn3 family transposase [Pelomonas sp. Root1444]|uniref:Tn3 family transposase n=1 Tax=Pelomonas sp. Root1444 TaxID=1736464 RepID=UPI000A55841F
MASSAVQPPIRDLASVVTPTKSATYDNIDSLFKGTINWKLIETHLPMMFKIVHQAGPADAFGHPAPPRHAQRDPNSPRRRLDPERFAD